MKKGYTLAEVLITLGVIGVVAAVTLPTLIQNHQKQQTVSKLKKAYTVLSQAYKMSTIDNGDFENWDLENYTNSNDFVEKFFKPYLKTIKTCNTPNECNYTKNIYGRKCGSSYCSVWGCLEGKCVSKWYKNGITSLVLSDGTYIFFETIDSYGNPVTTSYRSVYIDTNGPKGPNTYGKDFFSFEINKNGLFSKGYDLSTQELNSNCSLNGLRSRCASKIIRDGWQISKDYPW